LIGVPNLLLVHLPTASRSGQKRGWNSDTYKKAVREVDTAIEDIVKTYQEFEVLDETMFIVTGLNGIPLSTASANGSKESSGQKMSQTIPWISWGANVKGNYSISGPVSILDTGATILYALGLETHTEWDSHAINEIFRSVPKRRTTGNDPSISIH
jgi:arylsulfatase A-like enzyme